MAQVGFPRLFSKWGSSVDARWDLVAIFGTQLSAKNAAQATNPSLLVMLAPLRGATYEIPAVTYGAGYETFTGATDSIIDGQAAMAGVIRPYNVYWDKLYKADGTVALNPSYNTPIWNLANIAYAIGIEKTWQHLGRVILYRLKQNLLYTNGWDGYYSDNWIYSITAGWFSPGNLDADRNGAVDATSTLIGNWGDGLAALGHYLRTSLPGMIVGGNGVYKADPRMGTWVANHTDKEGWRESANFTEIEDGHAYLYSHTAAQNIINVCTSTNAAIDPTTGSSLLGWNEYPDPYGQERYVAFFFFLRDDSGNQLATPANFNSPSVYKAETYYKPARKGMALACICEAYYWPKFNDDSRLFYDDEMLGGSDVAMRNWMGQPTAAPVTAASGVFYREFEDGLALVNINSTPQTVYLPGGAGAWRKIAGTAGHNDGGIIGETFTIPAHDGRLFVRVLPTPGVPPLNLTLPTISGLAETGETLTGDVGTWQNSPTSYDMTWAAYNATTGARIETLEGPVTITPPDTDDTYVIAGGHVGQTVRIEIVATNAVATGVAISAPTDPIDEPPSGDERLDGPGWAIQSFTIASESLPSSIFPAWAIQSFTILGEETVRYFKRLVGPRTLPATATSVYTVSDGYVGRILNIHLSNPSAAEVDISLSIGTDAAATRVYDDFALPADSVETNHDPYDLAAGESIEAWASVADTVVVTVSGYEETV